MTLASTKLMTAEMLEVLPHQGRRLELTACLESIATVFVSISSRNAVLFTLARLPAYTGLNPAQRGVATLGNYQ
jgi:hypothetical protein